MQLEASRSPGTVLAAALAWAGIAAAFGSRLAGNAVDDFYITYRYAWNFAAGQGLVFNPGERVFGLTDPGAGLVLGALHALTRIPIPVLGTALTGLALVWIAVVLLLEARDRGRTAEGVAAGTLIAASTALWVNQGAGIFLALALLLQAARTAGSRPVLAGLLAGAAVWMRPDAGLGVLFLGLLLVGEGRRIPWRFGIAAAVVTGLGAAAAWAYFGTPLPNTLAAKAAMAAARVESWSGLRFWPRAAPVLRRHWGPLWGWIAAAGAAGLVPLWRHAGNAGRAGRLLALFGAGLAVAYPLLRVPFFFWYAVPSLIAVLAGVPFLAGAAGRLAASALKRSPAPARAVVGAAVALLILVPLAASLGRAEARWLQAYRWPQHLEAYRQAGIWIRAHSDPSDDIAYVEIGVPAYYSERKVVDLLGLVTPEAVPYVTRGDLPGAFLLHPTRFVLYHSRSGMLPLLQRRWFWTAYEEVHRIEIEDTDLRIFRRIPGSELPPPHAPGARVRHRPKADRVGPQ
jgi:hypothetical protein